MSFKRFIRAVAENTDTQVRDADRLTRAVFEVIAQAVADGEDVRIPGFGVFQAKERPASKAFNIQTREPMLVPPMQVIRFQAAPYLRRKVAARKPTGTDHPSA